FTPDLMPADLLGTSIYNQKTQDFEFHPGPIFADLLLADEVNR
ncbi:MAG TPA: magnesium chelatase, partial [Acidobacteria bacterium]|nr:magnesium chelatase [Acidobacteriota bacterium]